MRGSFVTAIATMLLLSGLVGLAAQKSMHTSDRPVLSVKKSTDSTKAPPESSLYAADLFNPSNEPVTLEAVQMPGGYVGSGQFFRCDLQRWSRTHGKWTRLRQAKLSSFGHDPHLVSVSINPHERLQVCALALPSQAGTVGDCVRFRLQTRWKNGKSEAFVSTPFLIDGGKKLWSGSCQRRERR